MRMILRGGDHHAVAPCLGKNTGRTDGRFASVAANDGFGRPAPAVTAALRRKIAVDQRGDIIAAHGFAQALHRDAHGQHGRAEDIEPVDFFHIDNADPKGAAGADGAFRRFTRLGTQFLGIVHALRDRLAQQHRSRHNRPGKWTTARLVNSGDKRARAVLGTKFR